MDAALLAELKIPPEPSTLVTLTRENVLDLAFVTGADHQHYDECSDEIGSIQRNRPNSHIIYYDLGLFTNQSDKVSPAQTSKKDMAFKTEIIIKFGQNS